LTLPITVNNTWNILRSMTFAAMPRILAHHGGLEEAVDDILGGERDAKAHLLNRGEKNSKVLHEEAGVVHAGWLGECA
jgi:hypothetical protein